MLRTRKALEPSLPRYTFSALLLEPLPVILELPLTYRMAEIELVVRSVPENCGISGAVDRILNRDTCAIGRSRRVTRRVVQGDVLVFDVQVRCR